MEVTNRKVRVTSSNLELVRNGIPVLDQRRAIKIGVVVTTAWTENNGFITVIHNEGWALRWENVGPVGMPGTPPSKQGTWIDAAELIMFDDGTMCGLDGIPIKQ